MAVGSGHLAPSHVYVDESIRKGVYLMAAVVVRADDVKQVASSVRAVVPRGQRRTHFSSEGDKSRRAILDAFGRLDVEVLLATTTYRGGNDQPARDRCLRRTMEACTSVGGSVFVFDSRQAERDVLDRRTIANWLEQAGLSERVRYGHVGSREEPLLCLPDAFAWAYGAAGRWRQRIGPLIREVATDP